MLFIIFSLTHLMGFTYTQQKSLSISFISSQGILLQILVSPKNTIGIRGIIFQLYSNTILPVWPQDCMILNLNSFGSMGSMYYMSCDHSSTCSCQFYFSIFFLYLPDFGVLIYATIITIYLFCKTLNI